MGLLDILNKHRKSKGVKTRDYVRVTIMKIMALALITLGISLLIIYITLNI